MITVHQHGFYAFLYFFKSPPSEIIYEDNDDYDGLSINLFPYFKPYEFVLEKNNRNYFVSNELFDEYKIINMSCVDFEDGYHAAQKFIDKIEHLHIY